MMGEEGVPRGGDSVSLRFGGPGFLDAPQDGRYL